MIRILSSLAALVLLAACAAAPQVDDPLADLGAFRLGHNVVVATKMQQSPVSRDATAEEWTAVLKPTLARRFGQYQGNQLYHLGISIEGFALAPAGVPLLYKPKSALILNVTVWDDAAGTKLNAKPEQFTVFEQTTGESFLVGSGNKRTKEQQMAGLAANAARKIEEWMAQKRKAEGWFEPRPGAATEAIVPRDELAPAAPPAQE